eukprot:CAMPEP_0170587624 /NCGR_PEP_ID=MMETSP0224-20130122/10383_1 /TAXON_ID=285029 /ORGANISM="Togula jolla, Strain CCCM 725" /LENGTH=359 /DNA_ID=CAMNT_0010911261 /DNA_START=12 /DNA_END=1089 /DNA_ORIENTATION=+
MTHRKHLAPGARCLRQLVKEKDGRVGPAANSLKERRLVSSGADESASLPAAQRPAVGGGGSRALIVRPPSPKTPEERRDLRDAIWDNENLQAMVALDSAKVSRMVDIAWREEVPAGKELITEGDLEADYFYVVHEGQFEISVGSASSKASRHIVGKGGSFGELALLYLAARAATVRALTDATVWVIDRANFKAMLAKSSEDTAKEDLRFLDNSPALAGLSYDEKYEVAKALTEMTFSRGEHIIEQGEIGSAFYILYDGIVTVVQDGRTVAHLEGSPERAEIFGERALRTREPRCATVTVTSSVARVLMGDLVTLGLLGFGGFGAVSLVESRKNGATFALKALSKGYIVASGMKSSVARE